MDIDENFKSNVDSWIKRFNKDIENIKQTILELSSLVSEQTENIQHNYQLIYEIKDELRDLKLEIQALKLIQIITIKQQQKKEELIK